MTKQQIQEGWIEVFIERYPGGGFIVKPTDEAIAEKYRQHVISRGGSDEPQAYVQGSIEIFDGILSDDDFRILDDFGDVTVKIDPYYLGQFYGYDATEVRL